MVSELDVSGVPPIEVAALPEPEALLESPVSTMLEAAADPDAGDCADEPW